MNTVGGRESGDEPYQPSAKARGGVTHFDHPTPPSRLAVAQVLAHPDDDILFNAAELLNFVAAGSDVLTLIVSAGEVSCNPVERQRGLLAAHRQLYAEVGQSLTPWVASAGGDLPGMTATVSPTGALHSVKFLNVPDERLWELWLNPSLTVRSVDEPGLVAGGNVFRWTRASIINALRAALERWAPQVLLTMDPRPDPRLRPPHHDHPDHTAVALMTDVASRALKSVRQTIALRGYNVQDFAPLYSKPQRESFERIFSAYSVFDPQFVPHPLWQSGGRRHLESPTEQSICDGDGWVRGLLALLPNMHELVASVSDRASVLNDDFQLRLGYSSIADSSVRRNTLPLRIELPELATAAAGVLDQSGQLQLLCSTPMGIHHATAHFVAATGPGSDLTSKPRHLQWKPIAKCDNLWLASPTSALSDGTLHWTWIDLAGRVNILATDLHSGGDHRVATLELDEIPTGPIACMRHLDHIFIAVTCLDDQQVPSVRVLAVDPSYRGTSIRGRVQAVVQANVTEGLTLVSVAGEPTVCGWDERRNYLMCGIKSAQPVQITAVRSDTAQVVAGSVEDGTYLFMRTWAGAYQTLKLGDTLDTAGLSGLSPKAFQS